jgi:predicted phage tail component-like protein
MLYEFTDTSKQASTGTLPAEAMSYDGVFLENEIDGYRTLNVSGRELMSANITSSSIDGINGSQYQNRTYPSRTITVKYQLIAENDRAFREAFNKMNYLLSGEQVKVIFNDEPDKYFIGTKQGNDDVDPGINSIIGEFEIYCSDPFKYATTKKEFEATLEDGDLVANIVNAGTEPAVIDYEITNNSETGYLGIVSDNGVMEFGKIEEVDGTTYQQNETLATLDNFFNIQDDVGGYDAMHPLYGTSGSLATATWFNNKFLKFGTAGTQKGSANGGLRTLTIPVDSNGDKGAKNWYSYFHILMWASKTGQTGEMSISFLTDDNKLIAGCNWYKTDTTGNSGMYDFVVYNPNKKSTDKMAGRIIKEFKFTTSHLQSQNPWYWSWGHCDLRKEGSKITFYYWGKYYSYTIPEIADLVCTKVQIAIKQWGNRSGDKFMYYLGFNRFTFQKMHVEKWNDVPNRFPKDSVLTIDGETSHFFIDGMQKQNEEVLGTQYFKAPPGNSKIKFHVSEWTKTQPTVKVRIREVWL